MLLTENLKPNEKVLSPEKAAKIMTDILLAEKDGEMTIQELSQKTVLISESPAKHFQAVNDLIEYCKANQAAREGKRTVPSYYNYVREIHTQVWYGSLEDAIEGASDGWEESVIELSPKSFDEVPPAIEFEYRCIECSSFYGSDSEAHFCHREEGLYEGDGNFADNH